MGRDRRAGHARGDDCAGRGIDRAFFMCDVRPGSIPCLGRRAHALFNKRDFQPEQSRLFRFASRRLRVSHEYHGEHFFVRIAGRLFATPLFLVLLVVEITDVTLAADSIPAVFGITRDPFIVYTSNVLAILGLRALYFLLAGVIDRFRFLGEGLAIVLVFIGAKMIGEGWLHIPVTVSLGVVAGVLLIALLASLLIPRKKQT